MRGGGAALVRACGRCVTDGAVWIKSGAIQPKGCALIGRMRAIVGHPNRDRGKIPGLGHVDQVRSEVQLQRRLDIAGVDAVSGVIGRERIVRQTEAPPLRVCITKSPARAGQLGDPPTPNLAFLKNRRSGIALFGESQPRAFILFLRSGLSWIDLCPRRKGPQRSYQDHLAIDSADRRTRAAARRACEYRQALRAA